MGMTFGACGCLYALSNATTLGTVFKRLLNNHVSRALPSINKTRYDKDINNCL